ncbi:MAG: hydroxymethylbilane synthase [Cytophagaceae bacterium]|nr:hydroxymethylbilane synthase [Cytophagaceae bacterium]
MNIRIGTRGSKLALWQAHFVQDLLQADGLTTEIVTIETKGDQVLDRSLSKIGSKGVFTQELEDGLFDASIDIAVHSAKDLQSELPDDLELIAFTERELVNDVLVSRQPRSLQSGERFVIGTSSTRRIALLKHFFPHIRTVEMRGNLQTRLRKLDEGQCDALLLAYAGVHRMGYDDLIVEMLPAEPFVPAVGQGSIAVECAKSLDEAKKSRIRALVNHPETEVCLLAERAFLRRLQGGCSIPVFGLATHDDGYITLTGGLISLDGDHLLSEYVVGSAAHAEGMGTALGDEILQLGGAQLLAEIKRSL